jgi:hypothetical protein
MKDRKVLNLRTHVGGVLGKTSYDAHKDAAEMELTAVGVMIHKIRRGSHIDTVSVLVPFANVIEVALAPEDEKKK